MFPSSFDGFCGPHPEGEGPISGIPHRQRNRSWCTLDLGSHRNPDPPCRNWGKVLRLEVLVIAIAFSLSKFYLPVSSYVFYWYGPSCLSSLVLKTDERLVNGSDPRFSVL